MHLETSESVAAFRQARATCISINAKGAILLFCMLGSQFGEGADDVGSTVLGQRPGDDFQGSPNSPVGASLCSLCASIGILSSK